MAVDMDMDMDFHMAAPSCLLSSPRVPAHMAT